MKKYKAKLIPIISSVLFVALTSAVVVQFILLSTLMDSQSNERQARTWDTKLIYACYNHKIYPCDDEGVSKWNEQNPDKAVTEDYLRNPEF